MYVVGYTWDFVVHMVNKFSVCVQVAKNQLNILLQQLKAIDINIFPFD